MREVVFNGKYMIKENCRGVQRYTKEVLHAIDKKILPGQIKVIVPHSSNITEHFNNIEVVQYGGKISPYLWQNLAFQWYVWSHHAFCICLSDGIPFWNIGLFAIHDVRFLQDFKNLDSFGKKIRGLYTIMAWWKGAKTAKGIITVSEFSKQEIIRNYHIDPGKIHVCHNSWQHFQGKNLDKTIFETYKQIVPKQYYFLLGGREDNKNMKWVMKMAQKYPDRLFVLAGPPNLYYVDEKNVHLDELHNCLHVGYISDEQVKTLMVYCRAFLFPSKYEGFGIPPMEALSVGAKAIVSNATCLPEIYQEYVSYFDPNDYDADLDQLENEYHPDAKLLLKQYSWEKTAQQILDLIEWYAK